MTQNVWNLTECFSVQAVHVLQQSASTKPDMSSVNASRASDAWGNLVPIFILFFPLKVSLKIHTSNVCRCEWRC